MSTAKRHKKNLIVSYKNLSDDLKELFKESYPDGYDNYMQRFVKPNGETIFVVPFETDDTAYMVKFEVVIDTLGEDLDKALFDEDDERKKKLTLGINKEEIKAAFGEEEVDELDSYEKIGDDDEPADEDFEPSDEDLRNIEEEYLDAEIPPLDATIPEEEMVKPTAKKKAPAKKKK